MRLLRTLSILLAALLLLFLVFVPNSLRLSKDLALYVSSATLDNNLHEVRAGRLYRSAELDLDDLEKTLERYKIRTVIDLRRGQTNVPGERILEKHIVKRHGAEYFRVPLNSGRLPSNKRIGPLVELYDKVEEPILLHCTSGTHRSGVASAIWLMLKDNQEFDSAREQLSLRYGYFAPERAWYSWRKGFPTIDQLIWNYGEHLDKQTITFRKWLAEVHRLPKDFDDSLEEGEISQN